ncbi:MAG: PQQ-binding-like beta-propeller repeat protein, partial [Chloroflexota bacterium]
FGDLSGILHAVAVEDGNEIWNVALGSSISASPVYHQDRIYIVTEGGLLIAREASTNTELWQQSIQGQLLSDPLLIGDTLLVASSSGEPLLSAFVAESGASRWTFSPSEGS